MVRVGRSVGIVAVLVGAGVVAIACGGSDDSTGLAVEEGTEAGGDGPFAAETGQPDTSTPQDSSIVDAPSEAEAADAADAADDATLDGGKNLDGGACDGGSLAVTAVTPKFGITSDKSSLTITGGGFVATPKVYLAKGGVLTPVTGVAFVSSTSITGNAPSGLAVGTYDVYVVNPGDCASQLAGGFEVVADPVPVVLSVTPSSGTTQADVPVAITGCSFPPTATLATLSSTLVEVAQANNAPTVLNAADPACNGGPSYTMAGTILTKTKGLAVGAYVVRVKNPNGTYGDYSSFVVSSPNGNLTGTWKPGPSLSIGRRSLALASGRVDDANRFLYAVGGETAAGAPLKAVEIAQVDRFGQLGAWFTAKNQLGTARSGLTVVRQGRYLYVIGGTSSTSGTGGATPSGTPLGSIERAVILARSGAPKLTDPVASTASGTLAKGTYYYKVAAVLNATDPATEGETLPSDEGVAVLSASGNVALVWTAPAVGNVDHYRVYRTAVADGTSGAEVLLKDNIAGTSYTDTGADVVVPTDTPQPLGSTGKWVASGTSLLHARLDTAATIAADPTGQRHVFVTGGWGQCLATTGIMDCYEHATISSDGATLGAAFVAGPTPLAHARLRHGASFMSAENGPPGFAASASATTAFLIVAGGKGINTSANTVEYATIGAGGVLGPWASPTSGFANERDGTQLLVANGYGYALQGGNAPNYSLTADQSAQAVVTTSTLSFPNWSNAGANLAVKLGRHGAAAESAYFYLAGGTTNDADALTTVYQILH
jgi:hypothetical protein